jgi:hypothetical protein
MPRVPGSSYGKKSPGSLSAPYNKSGIYAGGSITRPKSVVPKSSREQKVVGRKTRVPSGVFRGGVGGSGVVKDQWVSEPGGKRTYVTTPEPTKGSGGAVPPAYKETMRRKAASGVDAGASRNAPGRPRRASKRGEDNPDPVADTTPKDTTPKDTTPKEDKAPTTTTSTSTTSSSSGDKPKKKTAPAVPGSLNYFMKQTMGDGRKNARNRAYQMFKNYKKSGKLPGDISSAS